MGVSRERLERAWREALNYDQFKGTMAVNRPALEANYEGQSLTPKDQEIIAKWPEMNVLVLAHDWCGDVVANLPLFARIEAETKHLKLGILLKDPNNTDIGLHYPHPDGDVHVPTYLFFSKDGVELGTLIERTEPLNAKVAEWIAGFWSQHPEYSGKGESFSSLEPEVKKALLGHLGNERTKVRELEKNSILAYVSVMTS